MKVRIKIYRDGILVLGYILDLTLKTRDLVL